MGELTYKAAADHLNVSQATVKNWTRQGLLSSDSQTKPLESDIIELKEKISTHKSSRLSSRANKSSAAGKFIPSEYIENNISRKDINLLALEINSLEIETSVLLLALSIILIDKAGLIGKDILNSEGVPPIAHKQLSKELHSWYQSLKRPPLREVIGKISAINIPIQRDTSGLVYQMLQNEGRKSEKGSYYTPGLYADEVLNLYGKNGQKFLDPCCGSGIFLLAAAEKYGSPDNIFGWDTDETAVRLARINLMLYFKDLQFEPRVFNRNGLTEKTDQRFDLIATNPPWGHHFNTPEKDILKKRFPAVHTGESFSYFIELGFSLLSPRGMLSYILPEALLKVKTHQDIRKILLDKVQIRYVKFLGNPFFRVQTQVIRMDMTRKGVKSDTVVYRKSKIYSVDSFRFSFNRYNIFDFNCNKRDYLIIDKIFSRKHQTLKMNALWILGIVSGNNERFISDIKKTDYEPFLSGQDISAFRIESPHRYIYFNKDILQQSAPGEYYAKHPKIVYKFITDKPAFAIDRKGYITLNSANSFFSHLETPAEIITALFNSSLYQFLYRKKFNSVKILKSHLEQLPVPDLTQNETNTIKTIVRDIELSKTTEFERLKKKLDTTIFQYFSISDSDRQYILENL
jgi:predicted RNA methylase